MQNATKRRSALVSGRDAITATSEDGGAGSMDGERSYFLLFFGRRDARAELSAGGAMRLGERVLLDGAGSPTRLHQGPPADHWSPSIPFRHE